MTQDIDNAQLRAVVEALVRLYRFNSGVMTSSPTRPEAQRVSFNDVRYTDTFLGRTSPGQYGAEGDPWPDETQEAVERVLARLLNSEEATDA
jgi:hypothetical protein